MDDLNNAVDILAISLPGRTFGVDSAEIQKVITGFNAGGRYDSLRTEFRSRGLLLSLEELTGEPRPDRATSPPDRATSALIINAGEGRSRLVTFSGTMEVRRLRTAELLPVPEYVRAKQSPFVIWGFIREKGGERLFPLVTLQFLPEEGSS